MRMSTCLYMLLCLTGEVHSESSESAGGFAPDSESSDHDALAKGKGKGKKGGKEKRNSESEGEVAPVIHPVPMPAPAVAADGSFYWGDFLISPVRRYRGGPQSGWGATCGLHWFQRDGSPCGTECKTSTSYIAKGITLSDEECILQRKRWILTGFDLTNDIGDDRYQHIFCR
jgi:hypothetical protein